MMYSVQRKVFALLGALRKTVLSWHDTGVVSPGAPEKVVRQLRELADELERVYEAMIYPDADR